MFSTLKSLFKSYRPQENERSIESPRDLREGDMLKFADSFGLPEALRGESFQVQQVATYFYTDSGTPEFVIKSGANKPLFLSIEDFDGEELLVISKKLKRKQVDALFGWDAVKQSMREKDQDVLTVVGDAQDDDWLSQQYHRRVFGGEGSYFEKDLRNHTHVPAGGESVVYYEYYSDDENYSFEIEVWDGDEIEAGVGVVRPFSDIVELWPGNKS